MKHLFKRSVVGVLLLAMLMTLAAMPVSAVIMRASGISLVSELGTASERTFTADPATSAEYQDGEVIHYMDFNNDTIDSWADTGYYMTSNPNPEGFDLRNDENGMKLTSPTSIGTHSEPAANNTHTDFLLTGNSIPQDLENFTVTVQWRFANANGEGFFGLMMVPANQLTDGSAKEINLEDVPNITVCRGNGKITTNGTGGVNASSQLYSETYTPAGRQDIKDGASFLNMSFVFSGRKLAGIYIDYPTQTDVWIPATGTDPDGHAYTLPGSTERIDDGYIGFTAGRRTAVIVKDIKVVAGSGTYTASSYTPETEIWPNGEGNLVQGEKVTPVGYIGYQESTSGTDIRFVGGVNLDDMTKYKNVGFAINVAPEGGSSIVKRQEFSTTTIYTSITETQEGALATKAASDIGCDYLYALDVLNFGEGTYTVKIEGFADLIIDADTDTTQRIYTCTYTLTVTAGVVTNINGTAVSGS